MRSWRGPSGCVQRAKNPETTEINTEMLEMINKRKWNNAYIKRLFLNVQLKLIYLHFWNFKNNIYTIWFAVYSQKYKLDIRYVF